MQKPLKKKKKSITIDDLARMVQIGFNETAKQKDMDNVLSQQMNILIP